jgi:hypothetical protein
VAVGRDRRLSLANWLFRPPLAVQTGHGRATDNYLRPLKFLEFATHT